MSAATTTNHNLVANVLLIAAIAVERGARGGLAGLVDASMTYARNAGTPGVNGLVFADAIESAINAGYDSHTSANSRIHALRNAAAAQRANA